MTSPVLILSNSTSAQFHWEGGRGTFSAGGVFSGGSVKLQASFDGGSNWADISTLSATGTSPVDLAPCFIRFVTTGAAVAAGTAQVETLSFLDIDPLSFSSPSIREIILSVTIGTLTFQSHVPVHSGDTPEMYVERAKTVLENRPELVPIYAVTRSGADLVFTRIAPFKANDPTILITMENGNPSPGLTPLAASTHTTAGVAQTPQISAILSTVSDTVDGTSFRSVFNETQGIYQNVSLIGAAGEETIKITNP